MNNQETVEKKRSLHKNPTAEEYGIVLKTARAPQPDPVSAQPGTGPAKTGTAQPGAGSTKPGTAKTGTDPAKTGTAQPGTAPAKPAKNKTSGGTAAAQKKKGGAGKIILLIIVVIVLVVVIGKCSSGNKNQKTTKTTAESKTTSETEAREPVYNYYTEAYTGSDSASFTPLAYEFIGSQTARYGEDMYITNIESESGDMVGDEPEILVVPWQSSWQNAYNIDWGMGSLSIYVRDEEWNTYNYIYEYVNDDLTAEEAYKTMKENQGGSWLSKKGEVSSTETVEINGHTYLYFYVLKEDEIKYYYLEDKQGYGVLVCGLTYTPQEKPVDKSLANSSKMKTKCVRILEYYQGASIDDVTAASPLSSKTIVNYSNKLQAVISRDIGYERQLNKTNKQVRGETDKQDYGYHDYYFSRSYYGKGLGPIYSNMTKEKIHYTFRSQAGFDPEEESKKTGYSEKDTDDIVVGEIQTYTVNGYETGARLVTFNYFYTSRMEPREILYIWVKADEESVMWIDYKIDNNLNGEQLNVDDAVARLAGANLKISANEHPEYKNSYTS